MDSRFSQPTSTVDGQARKRSFRLASVRKGLPVPAARAHGPACWRGLHSTSPAVSQASQTTAPNEVGTRSSQWRRGHNPHARHDDSASLSEVNAATIGGSTKHLRRWSRVDAGTARVFHRRDIAAAHEQKHRRGVRTPTYRRYARENAPALAELFSRKGGSIGRPPSTASPRQDSQRHRHDAPVSLVMCGYHVAHLAEGRLPA